ncbi:hypothetical protein AB0K81_26560 [Streptomyces werraensis]|uniref:Uncharacterized protein n=1 Tax=Streptomyces werraensis TaxID=68284 RepID=A0ABV3JMS3_9ACTN
MRAGTEQGPEIWLRGPVTAPEADPPGPASARTTARRFSWVGLHGGAGVSTLAAVYGGHDCGRSWPAPDAPRSVLLVARTHAAGLDAVLPAVELFRRGEAPHGLDLEHRVRLIEPLIDVYRVPWVPGWRLGDLGGRPPRETEPLARLTGALR